MATVPIKKGNLVKKAPDHGLFSIIYPDRDRFFCLDSNGKLTYFENDSSNKAKGTIDMKNVARVERDKTNKHHHLLVLYPKTEGDRVFELNAKDEKEQDEWCKALSSFLPKELSDDENESNVENENSNQSAGETIQGRCICVQETESSDIRRSSDATSGYGSTNTLHGSNTSLTGTIEGPDHTHMQIKCPNCSTNIKLDIKATEAVKTRKQPVEHTERPKSENLHLKTRYKFAVENGLDDITEDEEGCIERRCETVPKSFKVTFEKGSEEVKFNND